MNHSFIKSGFIFSCIISVLVILPAGPVLGENGEKAGVKIMEKEAVGKYLADSSGMSLYSFARDEKNISNCVEGCAVNWPPFYSEPPAVGEGLEPGDFSVITRSDGRQQTIFKGMPLYYFKNDRYPGDTFGDNLGEAWFLITP